MNVRKLCLGIAFLVPMSALAQDKTHRKQQHGTTQQHSTTQQQHHRSMSATKAYGMGGCGLGSLIFTDKSSVIQQILASTTNDTSGTQTFGITSGTSNCVQSHEESMAFRMQLNNYVVGNRAQLQNDIAKQSGESLAALEAMGNCQSGSLGATLQNNYAQIFAQDSNQYVADSLYTMVRNSPSCRI